MRVRKTLAFVLPVVVLVVGALGAWAFQASASSRPDDPPVRVTTDPDSRFEVYDLRDSEAQARRMAPGVPGEIRPPKSSGAPAVRLRVPAVGINAPVVTGYLTANGREMIAPNSASTVAWYEYTPRPGQGGNAVFSGHVDWVGIGPAVFWGLRRLGPGDLIEVDLADGSSLKYRVEFNRTYAAAAGPWGELFSPASGDDVITLYTCDGAFARGDYSDRRVVRATRFV